MSFEQDEIGQRIKARRKELGFSMRELARRTGLSASFISQVENKRTNVSLDSLRLIAEQLDISIHHFFSEPIIDQSYSTAAASNENSPQAASEMQYSPIVRAGSRSRLYFPDLGVNYELLVKDLTHTMEPIFGRLSPGSGNIARRLRKPTEEFIFVLVGKLLVGLEDEEHILNPGDSIYFEGNKLNKLACASEDSEVVWLSVITPPAF
jgi:transcriptional regulator with XRE-family HTH domain